MGKSCSNITVFLSLNSNGNKAMLIHFLCHPQPQKMFSVFVWFYIYILHIYNIYII